MSNNFDSISFGPSTYSLRAGALQDPQSPGIWSTPENPGSLRGTSGTEHTVCCEIIPPAYQRKIVEAISDPTQRELGRIKLAEAQVLRLRRKHEQRLEEAQSPSLIGKVDKQAQVFLYDTDSEYKLPGTLRLAANREPTLAEALAVAGQTGVAKSEKHKHKHKHEHKDAHVSRHRDASLDLFRYEAYFGLKNTLAFLFAVFQRRSYDNRGTDVRGTVDIENNDGDPDTNNAFWNGRQMYFGMGDQQWFGLFTGDQDVISHEFGHAVIGSITNLEYRGQSGAMNEHFADVIGQMAKQFFGDLPTRGTFAAAYKPEVRKPVTATESKWLIGEEVLLDKNGNKYALRSMENPGTAFINHPVLGNDDQPKDMSGYVPLSDDDDNGGVHKYSGILNRAFTIAAKKLGGYTWDHVGKVWLEALKTLKPTAQFDDLMKATLAVAPEGKIKDAVKEGWTTVGLLGAAVSSSSTK